MTHFQEEIQCKLQIERQVLSIQLQNGHAQEQSGSVSVVDVQMRSRLEVRLASIDRALHRLEKGTFGVCQSCGDEIDHARLEVLPYAEQCINCQRKMERKTVRPYAAYVYWTH